MTDFINLTPHAIRVRCKATDPAAEPRLDDIVVEHQF